MTFHPVQFLRRALSSRRGSIREGQTYAELERVALKEAITSDRRVLPRGATGTVVTIWGDGQAVEVEFTKPFAALVTLQPKQLERASSTAP